MKFEYNDGGRSKYFKAKNVGDCATRAICNASGLDYKEVYLALKELAKKEKPRNNKVSSVRDGVRNNTWKKYLNKLGWIHVSTMGLGTGITMHLNENELPKKGTYIVHVSKHLTCVKDGVLIDTYDCSRDGNRGVYEFWRQPSKEELEKLKLKEKEKEEYENKVLIINNKYEKELTKLKDKIKELNHKYKILNNRKQKEILKLN